MSTHLDPVVITKTRVHYVVNFDGRECASVEMFTTDGPYVGVKVSTYDDDVTVETTVKPG